MILALLLIPASTTGMGPPKESFWFCSQVGTMNDHIIMAHTPVHKNLHTWTYAEKAEEFEKYLQKVTKKEFKPAYAGFCADFTDPVKAQGQLDKILEKAKKLGFDILRIPLNLKEKRSAE